jgi:hypothetical protein
MDGVRRRIDRTHERGHLERRVGGQHPLGAQPVQAPEDSFVGDEEAAHAEGTRAERVLDAAGERVVTTGPQSGAAGVGTGGGSDVPAPARPGEQAEFDVAFGAGADHLGDLVVGEHPHAAALADAVDRQVQPGGLLEYDGQHLRPLAGRDLGAPAAAVGEPVCGGVRGVLRGRGQAECGEGRSTGAAGSGGSSGWRGHEQPLLFEISDVVRDSAATLRIEPPGCQWVGRSNTKIPDALPGTVTGDRLFALPIKR